MQCEICGNDYPSKHYFRDVPGRKVCVQCSPESRPQAATTKANPVATDAPRVATASRSKGLGELVFGLLLCVGGIVATAVSYESARSGGTYTIWYGAVLYGGYLILKGLYHLAKPPAEEETSKS